MQDVLTYEAWLDAVCHICNSLLKANVTITRHNQFKVVASHHYFITFIDCNILEDTYYGHWEPAVGATNLISRILDEWEKLLVEEQD